MGKEYWDATPGSYELRVDLARGIQQESDADYSNDSIAGANALTLTAAGVHQQATVAGTLMAPEGSNTDEDYFALGTLNTGNQVDLNLRLPSRSTLNGRVTLVDANDVAMADTDGNATDGHFLGTIAADGAYYAKVQPLWSYHGHSYLLTDGNLTWSQAEAYAQGLGGHLATVNDAAENEWLRTTFSGPFGTLWIGLTDQATEGTFLWASDQEVSYTNWGGGEPNNYDSWYGGDADYAWMQTDGKWADWGPQPTTRGLIELDNAGTGGAGAGTSAQYLLDVDVADLVPPKVTGVMELPAAGTTTAEPIQSVTVTLSEALDPATVTAGTRMVWSDGGHFYTLTQSAETWSAAETEAQALGGHLVTVNDATEQQWLTETFGRFGSLWLGFTDEVVEGTWQWASGEAAAYTNWAAGHPYNWGYDNNYDYAQLDSSGQWYNAYNADTYRGIIELAGADPDADKLPDSLDPYPTDPLNAWDLRAAGPDATFDTADDVIYRLTLATPYTGGTSVSLFINGGPLPSGEYRFTANATLTDVVGNALDGDGNGLGGDAYQQPFTVALSPGLTLEGGNNDTLLTATALPLTEDPAGSGYFLGRGLGSLQPSSDTDYWSFMALAGDVISISVDTPDSDLAPYLYLYDAAGSGLASGNGNWQTGLGPGSDAFLSHYVIPSSGTYYARVTSQYSGSTGSYELRVDLARGIQLETDPDYANDSLSGANALTWTNTGTHQTATIAGTVMAPGDSNVDEDYINLGAIQPGKTIFIS